MERPAAQPSLLRKWFIACRPWSWPASTMPVLFGTSVAVVIYGAPLKPFRFLLALVAMVILHSAANMLSDVFDFKRGLDRDVTPVSGAVVRGWLSTGAVTRAPILLFAVGSAIGLGLALLTGWTLFYRRRPSAWPSEPATRSSNTGPSATWPCSWISGSSAAWGPWSSRRGLLLDPRSLDGPDVHARHRHPPRQQLAGHRDRRRAPGQDDGLDLRGQGFARLLWLPALRIDGDRLLRLHDPA